MLNLAVSLTATGQPDHIQEAGDLLAVAMEREPDNAFGWYELSVIREKQGRRGEALLATAEQAFHLGDCNRALNFSVRAQREFENDPDKSKPGAVIRASDITKSCRIEIQFDSRRG